MLWATDAISIKVKLGGAATTTELPITGCYTEVSATGSIVGFADIHTITTGSTEVSIVGVAAAGNLRKLQGLRIVNVDTAAATVTIFQDDGTARNAIVVTLAVGYQLNVFDNGAWEVRDANGAVSGSGGAPTDADYLVKTANSSLSAERVVTDTATIITDWSTAGQAKLNVAGQTTLYGALDALTVTGANVASATTTDIGAATGESITITGTTTITGLGTKAAGCIRFVTFSGALILTHNATSLILPTAANITTVAGDTAAFVSLGSGNWKCFDYTRASGAALASSGSSSSYYGQLNNLELAATGSAGALTISLTVPGGGNPSSGTPVTMTFRSVTPADGTYVTRTITSATSLVLSSGSTLGVVSGKPAKIWLGIIDWVSGSSQQLFAINCLSSTLQISPLRDDMLLTTIAEGGSGAADSSGLAYTGTAVTGSGSAIRIIGYLEWTSFTTAGTWTTPDKIQIYGPGVPLPGQVMQSNMVEDSAVATGTTTLPWDDTIPQKTEGNQYLSLSLTPSSPSSLLVVDVRAAITYSGANWQTMALFRDSGADAIAAIYRYITTGTDGGRMDLKTRVVSATTSSTTFSMRSGNTAAGTTTFNGQSGARLMGGVANSFLTVDEVAT